MDQVNELLLSVAVLQLLADVPEIVDVELSLTLNVKNFEVGVSAFLAERASLNK